eukprot:7630238-Prorocentrum_lima.AAC.1
MSARLSFSPSRESFRSTGSSRKKHSLSPKFAVSSREGIRRRLLNRSFSPRFRSEFLEYLHHEASTSLDGKGPPLEPLP